MYGTPTCVHHHLSGLILYQRRHLVSCQVATLVKHKSSKTMMDLSQDPRESFLTLGLIVNCMVVGYGPVVITYIYMYYPEPIGSLTL